MTGELSVRQETILSPGGTVPRFASAFNADIGFNTLSIAVDNFTGYWIYLPNAANPYIPPFWVGVVRNVIHDETRAEVQWASPFTATQTPALPGSFANVTFTNYILPYAPGSLAGTPPDPNGPPVGPPPVNVIFDPTVIINGICDCIGETVVAPHGAKYALDAPLNILHDADMHTATLPIKIWDTDSYGDGVGFTIPLGLSGIYDIMAEGGVDYSWVTSINMFVLNTASVEPILSPLPGSAFKIDNQDGLNTNQPINSTAVGRHYLNAGAKLRLQFSGSGPQIDVTRASLSIEKLADRTVFLPTLLPLSFPGTFPDPNTGGNLVATGISISAIQTIEISAYSLSPNATPNDIGIYSPSLAAYGIPGGASSQNATGVNRFTVAVGAADWQIWVFPGDIALIGYGFYRVIP